MLLMIFALVASLGSLVCSADPTASLEAQTDRAVQQAVALSAASVVRIDTVGGLEQLEPGMASAGATTGLIVSEDGYLVSSAFHFVSKPSSILVTLPDGRRLPAQLVATDRQRMVTLLKVAADHLQVPVVAPRESFRVGQWAIAAGRTLESDSPSVSVGIVSALNRVWGKAIQTDAKISPINYGGPLLDIQGRVLGILAPLSPYESGETAGVEWYDSGIGFAVPLVDVLAVLDRLKTGEDLKPGLLGITFNAKDMVRAEPVIDKIRMGSPAEKAGLQAQDRITSVDGAAVERLSEMKHILGGKYADDVVIFTVQRGTETLQVDVTLAGELAPYQPAFLGILPARAASDTGVVVRAVLPESPAALAGLKPQDRIIQMGETPVTQTTDIKEQLSRIPPGTTLPLQIVRDNQPATINITASTMPTTVPLEVPAQGPLGAAERPESLAIGQINATLAGHEREYWMYVPTRYRPDEPLSLVIYLHPTLKTLERDVLQGWRTECELRGMILLAPKVDGPAGWSPNDVEYLADLIGHVRDNYKLAGGRTTVIGMESSAQVAALFAYRQPELIDGLALIDSKPLGQVPENSPERSLSIYCLVRGKSLDAARWPQSIEALRKQGYPSVLSASDDAESPYPAAEQNAELARWVDCLDRL